MFTDRIKRAQKKMEIMISGRATDEELDEKSGMWRWLEKNVD